MSNFLALYPHRLVYVMLHPQVAVSHSLKQTVQHMQADLLTAQEQLQHASCAAQQQAEQNHQLLLQMQQVTQPAMISIPMIYNAATIVLNRMRWSGA